MNIPFLTILSEAVSTQGLHLGEEELTLFETYHRELIFWNEKINLVSIRSEFDIPVKHFFDSLTILPFIPKGKALLLDIGAGAGFPSIPLKIVHKELNIVLIEASRKKSSFLKHIVRTLKLFDTVILNERVEKLIQEGKYREHFDVVTSRATASLPWLLRMGSYFLHSHGTLIAMKGKHPEREIIDAEKLPERAHFTGHTIHEITLPFTGSPRKIIIYKKL